MSLHENSISKIIALLRGLKYPKCLNFLSCLIIKNNYNLRRKILYKMKKTKDILLI